MKCLKLERLSMIKSLEDAKREGVLENTIYNADCLDIMKLMKPKSVDLVVTSPPYDNLREYEGFDFNFELIAMELLRIIKNGGIIVWIVGDAVENGSETGTSLKQALLFRDIGFNIHDTMIYEKNAPSMPDSVRYGNTWEYMFIFSKGRPKVVNLIKDKINRWAGEMSFGKTSKRQKSGELRRSGQLKTGEVGVRFNIWRYNTGLNYSSKDKIAFQHPAIFPDALASDHIQSWSNAGEIVLDPLCGSGTTCKMAKALGRKFIGIEINEHYCEIARRRLSQSYLDFS